MKVCRQHCFGQCVFCRPHLDLRFGSQVLLLQGGPCKIVDLSRKNCNLIENYLGRAGFVDLNPLNQERAAKTAMAVARTPNTRANFGRATRVPHRRVRVLRVGRTILILKNRTDLFAGTICAKMGEGAANLYLHQLPGTIIEYQVRFWRVQISTPHYESAISCFAGPPVGH